MRETNLSGYDAAAHASTLAKDNIACRLDAGMQLKMKQLLVRSINSAVQKNKCRTWYIYKVLKRRSVQEQTIQAIYIRYKTSLWNYFNSLKCIRSNFLQITYKSTCIYLLINKLIQLISILLEFGFILLTFFIAKSFHGTHSVFIIELQNTICFLVPL